MPGHQSQVPESWPIDRFKGDVEGGVHTDGDVGPMQVAVDRGCNPDDRKAVRVQCVSARLRSISADDDERRAACDPISLYRRNC